MMNQFVVWTLYGVRYLALRELGSSYYLTTICRLPN